MAAQFADRRPRPRRMWWVFRVLLVAAVVAGAVVTLRAVGPRRFEEVWSQNLPDRGRPIALSSPNIATLDGVPAVVVGDRAGHVYAYTLAHGKPVPGWPVSTGGIPVDSTPSVAALQPASPDDTVFIGVGNSATPHAGRLRSVQPQRDQAVVRPGQEPCQRP